MIRFSPPTYAAYQPRNCDYPTIVYLDTACIFPRHHSSDYYVSTSSSPYPGSFFFFFFFFSQRPVVGGRGTQRVFVRAPPRVIKEPLGENSAAMHTSIVIPWRGSDVRADQTRRRCDATRERAFDPSYGDGGGGRDCPALLWRGT